MSCRYRAVVRDPLSNFRGWEHWGCRWQARIGERDLELWKEIGLFKEKVFELSQSWTRVLQALGNFQGSVIELPVVDLIQLQSLTESEGCPLKAYRGSLKLPAPASDIVSESEFTVPLNAGFGSHGTSKDAPKKSGEESALGLGQIVVNHDQSSGAKLVQKALDIRKHAGDPGST